MNKKAITWEMVAKLVLALIVFLLVYLIVVKNIFNIGRSAAEILG